MSNVSGAQVDRAVGGNGDPQQLCNVICYCANFFRDRSLLPPAWAVLFLSKIVSGWDFRVGWKYAKPFYSRFKGVSGAFGGGVVSGPLWALAAIVGRLWRDCMAFPLSLRSSRQLGTL